MLRTFSSIFCDISFRIHNRIDSLSSSLEVDKNREAPKIVDRSDRFKNEVEQEIGPKESKTTSG
eukprot:m.231742 g.231742  ORF g.231742 m.231742 type:complete len:64 (-) comp54278_c5_seq16:246-437(-)